MQLPKASTEHTLGKTVNPQGKLNYEHNPKTKNRQNQPALQASKKRRNNKRTPTGLKTKDQSRDNAKNKEKATTQHTYEGKPRNRQKTYQGAKHRRDQAKPVNSLSVFQQNDSFEGVTDNPWGVTDKGAQRWPDKV